MAALSLPPQSSHLGLDMPGSAPRFLSFPRSVTAPVGTHAIMRCRISGDPPPNVLWERVGNIRLELGDRCYAQRDGDWYQLVISDLRLEDSGHYMCRASNWSGEGYAGAKLTVTLNSTVVNEPCMGPPSEVFPFTKLANISSSIAEPPSETHQLDTTNSDDHQSEGPDFSPYFLLLPRSQRLTRGQSGEFTCNVLGKPEPTIRWEKDGRGLEEIFDRSHYQLSPEGHSLSITHIRPPDAGVYVCRASNSVGQCLAAAVLLVDPTPRQGPEPIPGDPPAQVKVFTVNEGKHAKLRCLVTGKPRPEIVWRKDGRAVSPGRRTLIYEDRDGHFILKVLFCRQQDRGLYVCGASNTAGNTLSAVMLHVREVGDRFPAPLRDVAVREGQDAVLECSVPEGTRTSWYLEDQRLHPGKRHLMEEHGTTRRLIIRGARTDDDGVYVCQTHRGAQSIAEVAVRGPIVKKLPRRLEVAEGGNAAFCAETESEVEQVGWTRDGHILSEDHRTVVKSFGRTHVLVMVGVTQKDGGIIQFHAGLSESSCHLRVKAKGSSIAPASGEPSNRTLDAGQPVCLSCQVPSSGAKVRWMKDGQEVEAGGRFSLQSDGRMRRLLISSLDPSDSGIYTCHLGNDSTSFTVTVPEPPVKIINTSDNTEHKCVSGEPLVLNCEVSRENARVRWCRDGAEMQEDENIRVESDGRHHRLVIMCSKPEDAGDFVCNAGEDSVFYHVSISDPPVKIINTSDDTEHRCDSGEAVVLSCEVSRENARVRWYRDGAEVEESGNIRVEADGRHHRLVIPCARPEDSGEFVCDTGDDSVFYNVMVTEPPVRIVNTSDDAQHKSMTGDSVVLSCEVSRENAPVRWYKDGAEIQEGDNMKMESNRRERRLIISAARTEDSGEFVCDAGQNSVCYHVTVAEPPVKIVNSDDDAEHRHVSGERVVLSCEVSRESAPVHWYKDGEELEESGNVVLEAEGCHRRLIVLSAQTQDSGEFVCDAGDDSIFYNVFVKDPPVKIVSTSDTREFVGGECLELSCEVSRENAEVCWYKDDEEVHDSENVVLEADGCHRRLIILAVQTADSGEFVCDAIDDSAIFNVTVTDPPVKIVNTSDNVEHKCLSGERVILSCEVSRENAKVCWYKDGVEVYESEGLVLESDGKHRRLIIQNAQVKDSGEFVCDAKDDCVFYNVLVTEPPVKLMNTSVDTELMYLVGEQVELRCEVSRENASVRWYKDGDLVEEMENLSLESVGKHRGLTILSAETQHSGEYICDARDDSISYYVKITEPPVKFVNTSEDMELSCVNGDPMVLSCEVSRENARVCWYRDGIVVEESENIKVESNGRVRRLVIHSAQAEDSGEYVCDARDDAVFYSVLVTEPPTKIMFPVARSQELEYIVGERVELVLEVSRSSGLVRWFKDGLEVDEDENLQVTSKETQRSLILSRANVDDSGEYICDTDSDSITFDVKISEPPAKFVSEGCSPPVLRVTEGDPLSIQCELSRTPDVIRWFRNGTKVTPDGNLTMDDEGEKCTLSVLCAQPEHAGQYECSVGTDSRTFQVTVDEAVVVVLERDQIMPRRVCTVCEDLSLALSVSRYDGEVRWYKDGERLQDNPHILMEERGTQRLLTILGAVRDDAGEYLCDARNDSFSFYVTVGAPPVTIVGNTGTPEHHTLVTGDDLVLSCELSRPNFKVRWLKDGEELVSGGRVKITSRGVHRQLNIQSVRPSDSGRYTCDAGTDQLQAEVRVEAPRQLEFITELQNITVLEGDTATFKCVVSPEDVILNWELNGSPLNSDRRASMASNGLCHSLTLHGCRLSDSGTITANAEGLISRARLRVQEAHVMFTQGLEDKEVEEEQDVTFEVRVTTEKAEVHWVKQGVVIQPSDRCTLQESGYNHTLTIHGIQASDRGRYSCESLHDRTDCRLNVLPRSIAVKKGLQDVRCEEGSDFEFSVELSHEDLKGEWWKGGVRLTSDDGCVIRSSGRQHFLRLVDLTLPDTSVIAFTTDTLRTMGQLTVTEHPLTIIQAPQDFVVHEAGLATFQCEVSKQEAVVTWSKDGEELVLSTLCRMFSVGRRRILHISQCRPQDAGTYTCHVGDLSASATLRVLEQEAQILKDLQDVEIVENENAAFICELSCAQAKGEWFKNGEKIKVTSTTKIRQEGRRHFLLICGAQCEDSGEILFRARRIESRANLKVKELPVRIVKSLRDKTALQGHRVIFECKVSPARARVSWLKGSQDIVPSDKYQITCEDAFRTLFINDVGPEDEDVYTMKTTGGQTSGRLLVEGLSVQLYKNLRDVTVTAPQDACFECEVSIPPSRPPQWSLNGVMLHNGGDIAIEVRGNRHKLTLWNTYPAMSGTVRFTAGKTRSEAKLVVQAEQ
ncbi:obscurin-like protein 1 isoform 4-T4 [Anomaloglossus baeobatrachus]|uniref:obscurin-like protein 1 n=1 Tax=Anomaloglossus baeobatrachus TaxID=238106 RepID=UPI003F4FDDCC